MGLQAAIWALSGLYMTAVHIDIIHGDHFIGSPPPLRADPASLIDPVAASRAVPQAQGVRLQPLLGRPVYMVTAPGVARLVDARTGEPLPSPTPAQIRQIADHWFAGDEPLRSLALVEELPFEVRGAKPPLWRAEFAGWNKPTLYLSPATGELVTRRHELWRVFDFLWMLHIMDYAERENVNNWLLRGFTWGAVLMAGSGAWLLIYSFRRGRRRKGAVA